MRQIFLFCFACLISFSLPAQVKLEKSKKDNRFWYGNSVHLELGGHGIVYSVNYERNILNFNRFKTSAQIGASFYPAPIDLVSRLWVPVSLNQLVSFRQHHLELGAGVLLTQFQNYTASDEKLYYDSKFNFYPTAKIGYRYQKPEGKMVYKLLFTPLLESEFQNTELIPLGCFSIGYNF